MLVRPSGRCHHLPVNHVYRATHLRTGYSRAKPAAKAVAASHYAYDPAGVLALVGCPLDLARTDQAPAVTVRHGQLAEGHELPGKWKVAKQMIGRRLSEGEAKRLLAKLE